MDKKLSVSFIIPTLNAEKFLTECLSSIRTQDYPKEKIEILIVDAGSTDQTLRIAKKFDCKILNNPHINQEPGKNIGLKNAKGSVCFFLDADNVLAKNNWLELMVKPLVHSEVKGLLPQTVPPLKSNGLNRYLGYLFTDPFTWYVYGDSANPQDYDKKYTPIKRTKDYVLYKFDIGNHPLFGLAQGVGTVSSFKKTGEGLYDDILAGIKLIKEGGTVAYVPKAGVYHYHVDGFSNFLNKYRWRIRNNFAQKYKGFGMVNREKYISRKRRMRRYLFLLYAFSIILPLIGSLKLSLKYNDYVMLWHFPATLGLAILILIEFIRAKLHLSPEISAVYGR